MPIRLNENDPRQLTLLPLLSHRLKVLRLTYESFFNHAMREQSNEMPIAVIMYAGAFVNGCRLIFLAFNFTRDRETVVAGRWKMCMIEHDRRRDCGAVAWIMREYGEHVLCTDVYISHYAADRLNGARPSQKMIDRFHGARLSRDTRFLSDDPRRYHRPLETSYRWSLLYERDSRGLHKISPIFIRDTRSPLEIVRRAEGMRVIMIRDVD